MIDNYYVSEENIKRYSALGRLYLPVWILKYNN